jgi:hypothetical protein
MYPVGFEPTIPGFEDIRTKDRVATVMGFM